MKTLNYQTHKGERKSGGNVDNVTKFWNQYVTSMVGIELSLWVHTKCKNDMELVLLKGSKQHLMSQCVYFACRTIVLFGGLLSKKTYFYKEEFSNEIFWNFLFIVFIVAPICSMFFYNQFWINVNFLNCTHFARFCVLFWKIVTISNHTKTC